MRDEADVRRAGAGIGQTMSSAAVKDALRRQRDRQAGQLQVGGKDGRLDEEGAGYLAVLGEVLGNVGTKNLSAWMEFFDTNGKRCAFLDKYDRAKPVFRAIVDAAEWYAWSCPRNMNEDEKAVYKALLGENIFFFRQMLMAGEVAYAVFPRSLKKKGNFADLLSNSFYVTSEFFDFLSKYLRDPGTWGVDMGLPIFDDIKGGDGHVAHSQIVAFLGYLRTKAFAALNP